MTVDLDAYAALARAAKGRAAGRERRYPATDDGIGGDGEGYVGKGIDADCFILDGEFTGYELLRLAEVLGFSDVPALADAVLELVERVRELNQAIEGE